MLPPRRRLPHNAQGCCQEPRITHTLTQPWPHPTEPSPPRSKVNRRCCQGIVNVGSGVWGLLSPRLLSWGWQRCFRALHHQQLWFRGVQAGCGAQGLLLSSELVLRKVLGPEASLNKHPLLLKDVVLHC